MKKDDGRPVSEASPASEKREASLIPFGLEDVGTHSMNLAAPDMAPARDRIVILGRRGAGKTVYLARLYEQLWRSNDVLQMRAVTGATHQMCMDVIDKMQRGQWPPSTLGASYSEIEVKYYGKTSLLVALDYPGEVFHKAFVDDAESDDALELLAHIDRAAGVILLLDPAVVGCGDMKEAIDDDFGMTQAVKRIREWPGGDSVPIALVLTKCDQNKRLLRAEGGVRSFVSKRYGPLMREVGHVKIFASSAVRAHRDESNRIVPHIVSDPIGVVEPFRYCLKYAKQQAQIVNFRAEDKARRQASIEAAIKQERDRRRATIFWSVATSIAIVFTTVLGIFLWNTFSQGPKP